MSLALVNESDIAPWYLHLEEPLPIPAVLPNVTDARIPRVVGLKSLSFVGA